MGNKMDKHGPCNSCVHACVYKCKCEKRCIRGSQYEDKNFIITFENKVSNR